MSWVDMLSLVTFGFGGVMYLVSLYYGSRTDPASKVKWLKFMAFGFLSQGISAGIIINFADPAQVSRGLVATLGIAFYAFIIFSGLFYTAYNYMKDNLENKL